MIGQVKPHPEWRIIVDLFRAAEYGETLTHTAIAEATGLRQESPVYYRQMSQARRSLLRDHDIETENVPKVGYKRVEPGRYGERARRDIRFGTRRIKRGKRVVEAVPVTLLTGDQVREIEHMMRLLSALQTHATKVIRSMKNVLPPVKETLQLPMGEPDESTQTH